MGSSLSELSARTLSLGDWASIQTAKNILSYKTYALSAENIHTGLTAALQLSVMVERPKRHSEELFVESGSLYCMHIADRTIYVFFPMVVDASWATSINWLGIQTHQPPPVHFTCTLDGNSAALYESLDVYKHRVMKYTMFDRPGATLNISKVISLTVKW